MAIKTNAPHNHSAATPNSDKVKWDLREVIVLAHFRREPRFSATQDVFRSRYRGSVDSRDFAIRSVAELDPDGDQLSAVASGAWTSANADRLERLTDSLNRQSASTGTLDVSGVAELDTFGGWLIERAVRQADGHMRTMQLAATPDRYRGLLAAVGRTNRQAVAAPAARGPLVASLAALGAKVAAIGDDFIALVAMFGALTFAQLERFAKGRGRDACAPPSIISNG